MNILSFECANFSFSTAVKNCNNNLAYREFKQVRGQDSKALPLIIEALKEVKLDFKDLNFITTTLGPGSFTGLRVGLSLARGLRLALGIPIVPFNSFEWVYNSIIDQDKYDEIYVVLNSQREELFVKKYAYASREHFDPQLLTPQEIAKLITSKPTLIVGDGASYVRNFLKIQQEVIIDEFMPSALHLLEMSLKKVELGVYEEDRPLYLRPPDITSRRP